MATYPLPDIAVVKLATRVDHPSVWLADQNERPADGSLVNAHGFSTETLHKPKIARDVCHLTIGGLLEGDCLRVIHDRVPMGMSGSLVLDANTRRVCGFVKGSVDHGGVQPAGGWIVSVAALTRHVPEVVDANRWACAAWRDAADPGHRYLAQLFAKDAPPVIAEESERPPSYYLDPRRRITQFLPRKELDELADWCLSDTSGFMRLIYGPGGSGKTRLSVQLIDLLSEQPDWIAGRLDDRADSIDLDRLVKALAGRKVLLCIEDAEDWAYRLPDLLAKIVELDHRHLRILLLARTVGSWWRTLRKALHLRNWVSREPSQLEQIGKEFDRTEVLRCAYQDFRKVIFPAAPEKTPSALIGAASGETNVLSLHAAALAVVLYCRDNAGQPPQNTIDLEGSLGDMLDHERNWWQMWIHSPEVVQELGVLKEFDEHDFINRVLIVPALYQTTDETQGEAALVGVLTNKRFDAELASKVAATLSTVYPNTRTGDARGGWGPLQPDRLCEELVLEVLGESTSQERCNELVCTIFTAGVDEAQAEKALIVLARASGLAASAGAERATTDTALARQRANGCIRALLEQYPDPFLSAATTVAGGLSEPAPLIDIIRSTLRCASGEVCRRAAVLIPATIPGLAPLEAALWERCIELAQERSKSFTVSQELDLANQYYWRSHACERANDSTAALVAMQFAVELYQKVVGKGRADVRDDLAEAREVLATREKDTGHQDESLNQITRAIDTYQELVEEDEPHHLNLARAKGFKAQLLRDMGRHEEANREANEGRKPVSQYQQQLEIWLKKNLPQPVEDSSVHEYVTALDRYSGPRPSFQDLDLRIVLPVGHFAGPMFTSPDAESPASFEVRFRAGVFSLSALEYAVWAMAHGDPEIVTQVPSTRAVVEYAASQAGVEEPGPLFDRLVGDGLLVEVASEGESAHEFARKHHIRPLALGLGNTPQQLGGFQIGMPNAPRATVGYDVYHMWLFTHQAPTLWDAVSLIAREATEANAEQPTEGEDRIELIDNPDVLLTGLLRALPVLISTSCIIIDRL